MQINNRLRRLEKRTAAAGIPADIVGVIDTAYYDELTEGQKNSYCKYWNMEREAAENLQMYVNGTLHIKLERRPVHETTPAEFEAAAKEVEIWFKGCQEQYEREHKA